MDPPAEQTPDGDREYFQYYSRFVHQQNMLMDVGRTSAYRTAIATDLVKDKIVMDVGAGSGILSYFALLQGATKVYAVEASAMARHIQTMIAASPLKNKWIGDKLQVIESVVEKCDLNQTTNGEKVDVLISEPIGVLLLHERMVESFIVARDRFLKPGGVMVPSSGHIILAPFTDSNLWSETMGKARFWEQSDFYEVDLSPLAESARKEIFRQPVVGYFDSRILMSEPCTPHLIDFMTISLDEIKDIRIPFTWTTTYTGLIHGIGGWFDILLGNVILNTSPSHPATHWQQVRFLLEEPLAVNAMDIIEGYIHMRVNKHRSYDISGELRIVENEPNTGPHQRNRCHSHRVGNWELHDHIYWDSGSAVPRDEPETYQLYNPYPF